MERISLEPLPQDQYFAIESQRERQLQNIGDVIAYWLKYVTKEREIEGLPTDSNTHVMLGYENAPPHWPSVNQLTHWLAVLRDSGSRPEGENSRSEVECEARQSGPQGIARTSVDNPSDIGG